MSQARATGVSVATSCHSLGIEGWGPVWCGSGLVQRVPAPSWAPGMGAHGWLQDQRGCGC